MGKYPQFIDNNRILLRDVLKKVAKDHDTLRIATGYWDLEGLNEIIDEIKNFKKIKLIIGKEPLNHNNKTSSYLMDNKKDKLFPNENIKKDLDNISEIKINTLRNTSKILVELIKMGIMEVKIFRQPILHSKAYIFGELESDNAVGIVGSSNFTKAGLTSNSELNFLTEEYKIVTFNPLTKNQEHGHITWFEEIWNNPNAIVWEGEFIDIIGNSKVGDLTFGPYDVYMKTLMELFPEELIDIKNFDNNIKDYLHSFQYQNALSLLRKLYLNKVAMLSDSVGLGKTVTAASIINKYISEGKNNVLIVAPASLEEQWIEVLENPPWNLTYKNNFKFISQQNIGEIDKLKNKIENKLESNVNLFIIDEAHNYRNPNSQRYIEMLKLLQTSPNADVLLLTATPINNSLLDFSHVIQLGSKGNLNTRKVRYKSPRSERVQRIDFLDALQNIQKIVTKTEKSNEKVDWSKYKEILISGLRHYLVRSTRQGIMEREVLKDNTGKSLFPQTKVKKIEYKYTQEEISYVNNLIDKSVANVFENINPHTLNSDVLSNVTQRTLHPLDIIEILSENKDFRFFNIKNEADVLIKDKEIKNGMIQTIYKIINLIGFVPYKIDTYMHQFYGKSIDEVRENNHNLHINKRVRNQLSIHNILQITWLKRLESSTQTLLKSVESYREKLEVFEKWIEKGYLISATDLDTLNDKYDNDLNKAFIDNENYMINKLKNNNKYNLKKEGIIKREYSDKTYNIRKLIKDIERDKKIINTLINILQYLSTNKRNEKMKAFADNLIEIVEKQSYGKKVIVFSFFEDTIKYLENNLHLLIKDKIDNFKQKSVFLSGSAKNVEKIVKTFSPISKQYKLKEDEEEIDFLFTTDILSEGQNLQDAGILINYDLHWNPVRMIQRNGRINRLGSEFSEILIENITPHNELEEYLRLLRKLQLKLEIINNSIGNDQSVLGEKENPIEFVENTENIPLIYSNNEEIASKAMAYIEEDEIIDWIDNYSKELRDFIDSNSSKEVNRVKNIPKGKWNYLPTNKINNLKKNEVIGLFSASGINTQTNEKVKDSIFVKINKQEGMGPFSKIKAEYISENQALSMIKTTVDDNQKKIDKIKIDRETYIKNSKTEVLTQIASNYNVQYSINKNDQKVLNIINKYLPEYNHISIVQNMITKTNEEKQFKKLMKTIKAEYNDTNHITDKSILKYKKFINDLNEKHIEKKIYNETEGVLFYVK